MKKKLISALAVLTLLLAFTSCDLLPFLRGDTPDSGQGSDAPCEHTYSSNWSSSSTEHWHRATCEHEDLKSDLGAHSDADEDGLCDVCTYNIGHEHTFSEEWSSDKTHHWKVATCSHTSVKGELNSHSDSDSDGTCDTCSSHVHVVNLVGICTACGERVMGVNTTDISTVLSLILSSRENVSGGVIGYNYYSTTPSLEGFASTDKTVAFLLGDGYAYYNMTTSADYYGTQSTDEQQCWYESTDNDSAFGVYRQTYNGHIGDLMPDGAAGPNNLIGYYYTVSTLANAYGAENLLNSLYKLGKSNAASEYLYEYKEGIYSFSYNYLYRNSMVGYAEDPHVDYYQVAVTFSVSDIGTLTELNVECKCYTNSLENEIDNDFTLDSRTGTVVMKDTAHPDVYTYHVTQTEGERTYVSEYKKADFIPSDFTIYTDEELTSPLEGDLNLTVGEMARLYIGGYIPEGTSISFVADSFGVSADSASLICLANPITESFLIRAKAEGNYTLTVTAGDVTKTITVIAEAEHTEPPAPEPSDGLSVLITDTYTWVDFIEFTAPADGDYTFTVPAGSYVGAWGDKELSPWADFNLLDTETNLPLGGTKTISLKAGETYKFFVSSPVKNIIVYISYTKSDYTGDGSNNGGENNGDNSGTDAPLDPIPGPGTSPTPDAIHIEGVYTASSRYDTTVTVVIDATTIRFTFPNSNPKIITYVYSDGAFRFWKDGVELTNPKGMSLTVRNGVLVGMCYNMSDYTLVPADPSVDVPVIEEPVYELGSELNPILLDTLPSSLIFTSDTETKTYYKFTAVESCILTFTWQSADSWVDIFELDRYGYTTSNSSQAHSTSTFSFEITEGVTYRFSLGTWETAGECTVTLTLAPLAL